MAFNIREIFRALADRHLIMLKQAAGRPLDMDDILALREIAGATGQEAQ